jgi:hypothetical protein
MTALSEAQSFVTTLSAAYTNALTGKQKTNIRIGGTSHFTDVKYVAPTITEIFDQLKYWQSVVEDLTRSATKNTINSFSSGNSVPLLVRRDW